MPKHKTHKATRKRYKVTRSGKVKRGRPGRRHLLSVKSASRRRKMRRREILAPGDAYRVRILLGLE
jgi:large subunit ribosomal protein L35